MSDEQQPRVTIVIPSYAGELTIARAVESALRQCGGNVAVIVIIDDRNEATRIAAEAFGDRVRVVVNESNLGAPESRNRGLELATTAYVSFLDDDDYFCGDLLGPLIEKMAAEGAQLGFGPSVHVERDRQYVNYFVPDYSGNEDAFFRWFGCIDTVNTASVAWSADYLRSIGGWDASIRRNQDGELALRAMLLGARFSQSSEGVGVWSNDRPSDRMTGRTDNLASLLDVVAKLQSIPSRAVSDAARRRASARQLHVIAQIAYRLGSDSIGAEAMQRRRALGFPDRDGPLSCRLGVALRWLPARQRSFVWSIALGAHRLISGGRRKRRSPPPIECHP